MKKIKHSTGWHTVKDLTNKIKAQRTIIVIQTILLLLSVLFAFLKGR